MKPPRTLYAFRGLPLYYHGLSYVHTKLPEFKAEAIKEKIDKAPSSGTLLVSGCAAPIVNQLMDKSVKVVGCNFVDYYESRFSEGDAMTLPSAPVVVIYGIGAEPAKNSDYATRLLNGIIESYRSVDTLLLFETTLTNSQFQTRYGIIVKNAVALPLIEEDTWI